MFSDQSSQLRTVKNDLVAPVQSPLNILPEFLNPSSNLSQQ